jgi:hypothetical protein
MDSGSESRQKTLREFLVESCSQSGRTTNSADAALDPGQTLLLFSPAAPGTGYAPELPPAPKDSIQLSNDPHGTLPGLQPLPVMLEANKRAMIEGLGETFQYACDETVHKPRNRGWFGKSRKVLTAVLMAPAVLAMLAIVFLFFDSNGLAVRRAPTLRPTIDPSAQGQSKVPSFAVAAAQAPSVDCSPVSPVAPIECGRASSPAHKRRDANSTRAPIGPPLERTSPLAPSRDPLSIRR